jgi:serine/threonine protein kinase
MAGRVTQFSFNADYPGVDENGSTQTVEAADPAEFPAARPIPCARITTRVYHPRRQETTMVQNVLVRTGTNGHSAQDPVALPDDASDGSSWSLSSDGSMMDDTPSDTAAAMEEDRAYWIQRTVREAIYGRVIFAVVLKRRRPTPTATAAEWEVTEQHCAVKEMSWQHIRKERDRLAEDPIKEVAAMQYLKQWHRNNKRPLHQQQDGVTHIIQSILETNIMMPLDLLSDDRNLYSIMPYCDGGELFERLDLNERFPEAEARYWMHQILNVRCQQPFYCHPVVCLTSVHDVYRALRRYKMREYAIGTSVWRISWFTKLEH